MNTLKFEFSVDEANAILASLAKMPYDQVVTLIAKIRDQAQQQLASQQPAPAAE